MIFKIRQWCEDLVIAMIISIIIEIMIPEGSYRKYAKVITGIYILFVILNPILEILNNEIKIPQLNLDKTEETYVNLDSEMQDIYVVGIEETIKEELKNLEIPVEKVTIKMNSKLEKIEKIVIVGKDLEKKRNSIAQYFNAQFLLEENKIEIREER